MTYSPIWKDYTFDITSIDASFTGAAVLYYRVLIDAQHTGNFNGNEVLVATGKAYLAPGATDITIKANDIVADHFSRFTFPADDILANDGWFHYDDGTDLTCIAVKVDGSLDGVTWEDGSTFPAFIPDWSYDYGKDWAGFNYLGFTGQVLNDPVRWEIPLGAFLPLTVVDFMDAGVIDITYGTSLVPKTQQLQEYDNSAYGTGSGAQKVAGVSAGNVIRWYGWDNTDADIWNGHDVLVTPACHRYVLYYQNAYGGWDWLEVRGEVTKAEAYERATVGRSATNAVQSNIQRFDYRSEVTERWTLRLGTFTDDEATRMRHLAGTLCAYLYDMQEEVFIPLHVTDTECVEKTYKNQGRKRVEYTITAETARFEQRR